MTEEERWKIIDSYELGISRAIINASYSIKSLIGSLWEPITINKEGMREIAKRSNNNFFF
jgi:hypothetical protein